MRGSATPSFTITMSPGPGARGSLGRSTRTPAAAVSSSSSGRDISPRNSTARPVAAIATASSCIVRRPPSTQPLSWGSAAGIAQPASRLGSHTVTILRGILAEPARVVGARAYIALLGLTLVTGPANSGGAGEVLGAYRARLEEEPILVVPAFRDVEHTLRELAGGGAVFGTTVVRFGWLFRTIAERCGAPAARVASPVQTELIAEEAVRGLDLGELRASASQPGFARAAARLVAELERSMVEPATFERALEQWAGHGPRRRYAREVASIYRAYRERLAAAGLVDADLFAWRAVDALREHPDRFGRTPVLVYGFDDFTPIELDALETLAMRVGVDVTVSLPYERGRPAFRAVAPLFERLRELADRHVELPAISEWYADESRAALHHLERGLYEGGGERLDPGAAVRLFAAGGARAEVEQVAAEALRRLRGGPSRGDVPVVFREPRRYASLVEQVFDAYGVPFSIDRYVPFGHTALGRGLLALLRCATSRGTADDLLAYLRTPGRLELPRIADRLEADVRREGVTTAAGARKLWESARWKLPEIDRLRKASGAE